MNERAIIAAILMHAYLSTGSDRAIAAHEAVTDADALLKALEGKPKKPRKHRQPAVDLRSRVINQGDSLDTTIPVLQYELGVLSEEAQAELANSSTPPTMDAIFNPHDPYWKSDDARRFFDDLVSAINAHAPDGWCFGEQPDNALFYGYWRIEDEEGTA